MLLTVKGYTASMTRYRYLWGFYVTGFKPWEHCQPCFRGSREERVRADMEDGVVRLNRRTDFFYLHGNAKGPASERRDNNLHLAVRPKAGSMTSVTSCYGPVFTIEDAEAITIQGPILGLQEHPAMKMYYKCPNFRFGMQMYPTPLELTGPEAPRIVRLRRDEAGQPPVS